MDKKVFTPTECSSEGMRLDVFLSGALCCTRSHAAKLIETGNVTVDGKIAKKCGVNVGNGSIIEAVLPSAVQINAKPQDIPIDIVYEDDDIVVVNKAQGMVTHPSVGSPDGTLVNALMYYVDKLSGINGVIRPGIVHRLDKDTSGLLVVAKNDISHNNLAAQIAKKTAKRYYYALVDGVIGKDSGVIDKPIGRSLKNRKQMAVLSDGGRNAVTLYKVLYRFSKFTLVEFELKTGRTHQIRVHSKSIGHPVVGDVLYGTVSSLAPCGQLLHAHKLVLKHPITNNEMCFEAPLPKQFIDALDRLGYDFSSSECGLGCTVIVE